MAQLESSDYNKDIKELRHKLTRVYLNLSRLNKLPTIDHQKQINKNFDAYMADMEPFLVKVQPDLKLSHKEYAHIGYVAWSDFYDVDGEDLYGSKKWSTSVEYYKKGESKWHRFFRGFKKSLYK